jgi:Domain of unknown function (DUF4382)
MKNVSRLGVLCVMAVILPWAVACSGSGSVSVADRGRLEIRLTDAPLDLAGVAGVDVTIDAVTVYPGVEEMDGTETAPIVIMDHPATFDLLTLTGGASTLLASADLPSGFYQRIRLSITAASLRFDDGHAVDLKIDSNKVDIPIRFQVMVNDTATVTLDFQADASVQVNGTASGTYILRPVVTPVAR